MGGAALIAIECVCLQECSAGVAVTVWVRVCGCVCVYIYGCDCMGEEGGEWVDCFMQFIEYLCVGVAVIVWV